MSSECNVPEQRAVSSECSFGEQWGLSSVQLPMEVLGTILAARHIMPDMATPQG